MNHSCGHRVVPRQAAQELCPTCRIAARPPAPPKQRRKPYRPRGVRAFKLSSHGGEEIVFAASVTEARKMSSLKNAVVCRAPEFDR